MRFLFSMGLDKKEFNSKNPFYFKNIFQSYRIISILVNIKFILKSVWGERKKVNYFAECKKKWMVN